MARTTNKQSSTVLGVRAATRSAARRQTKSLVKDNFGDGILGITIFAAASAVIGHLINKHIKQ